MRKILLLCLPLAALLLCGRPVAAATACPATGTCACTVGTGATTCLAAKTAAPYRDVVIQNLSASATIACTDDGSTPAIGAAGSWTIAPGTTSQWASSNVAFTGPFICIASAAATPVTVKGQ